ncbi:hypothetical protein OAG23_00445, partial [bacterium]|nr:hypothetical protein [bacterium]
ERRYDCDDQGRTILPFSNNPGTRSIVIEDADGFATLARIEQREEDYSFYALMHLEQEALRTGGMAKIAIRPILDLSGQPISLKKITSASLHLSSTNLDGLPATTTVPDFKLMSDREAVHEFRVPERIKELTATLHVKIKVASKGGEEIELTTSTTFKVNEFLTSKRVGDLYLSKIGGSYRVEFLGRNGESLSGQNLTVNIHHYDFKKPRNFTLKTDEVGGIDLGNLADISRIGIHEPSGQHRTWHLKRDRRDHEATLTLAQGQELKVPFVGELTKSQVAFFSYSRGGYVTDEFSKLKLTQGNLTAANLPAGDYILRLKERQQAIQIFVADGTVSKGHVFSNTRMLELPARQPSHIASLKAGKDTLEIDVSGVDPLTRIHVIATRFLPGSDPFMNLGGSQRPELTTGRARHLPSLYISGRTLGDELRYILERRYADKFPGNMLTRPEILLNPWAIRDTETGEESLADGDKFDRKPVPGAPLSSAMRKSKRGEAAAKKANILSHSYEFLANDPVIVTNLVPDENGKLSIKLDAFGNRQHIHVLLVDPDGATYRSVSLPDRETKLRDLRLLKALDQKRHFTEQERVTLLKKGDVLKLPDLVNAEFEVFDHLGSIHRYFLTLSENKTLREFEFITKWSSLTEEEKNDKYSKYACHELSFFLSRKDPAFFKAVVLPHLANKKDRTFMDDYLLGKPLEKYLEAYQYARLNVVERLLLSQSDPKRLAALALDLENRMALKAPNLDQSRYWFGTAFSGGAFGGGYAGGLIAESQMSVGQDDPFASDGEPRALGLKSRGAVIASASRRSAKLQKRALVELQNKSRESKSEYFGMDAFSDSEEELKELLPALQQLYRSLEPTKEWAENNYYQLRISEHNYDLVGENNFWLDLAKHGLKPGFGSRHLGEATGNFSEMMLALAFLDLPFDAPEHKDEIKGGDLTFTSGGPALLFHREIKEAGMAAKRPALLVSQSYFQLNDRFRMENGEKVDKFITEEFMRGIVYGSQVVVTNPTSSRQLLDILTQIPKGAIPVMAHRSTTNQQISLDPYSTHRLELTFYFPTSGEFPIYPAHLSKVGEVVAHADPLTFKVVDQPSSVDETSWTWISQWGEEALVLKYLETANLHATNLTKIAWRCRESNDFYKKAVAILDRRGIFERTLQSYALAHNDKAGIGQFLLVQSRFLNQCGMALSSELVTVDPIDRRSYEHLEYKPLINNRAHSLGGENRILNPVVRSQYQTYLTVLSQQKELDDRDQLGVTYYLFLQDRVSEALAHLAKVDAEKLETKIQFDYFQAYAAFYQADLGKARSIAKKYEKYPVDRWRERFAGITAQLAEIDGAGPEVIDDGNREQEQQAAASREPSLDLKIEGTKATLDFQNVAEVTVNYYEMDLEFLFSTNPFVSSGTSRFSIIQPNESTTMKLLKGKRTTSFDLSEKYRASNVIVEILGGGKTTSKAVYANELKTTLSESMGLLTVRHGKTGKALPKVYIKVYARTDEGVKFFKDGYTDLRGKFDYASVSSTGLGKVERFSILVMSEEQGATVLEASAPRR